MGGDITGAAGPGARRQPIPADPPPAGAEVAAGTEQQQELSWEPALVAVGVPPWLPAETATKPQNLPSPLLLENLPKTALS